MHNLFIGLGGAPLVRNHHNSLRNSRKVPDDFTGTAFCHEFSPINGCLRTRFFPHYYIYYVKKNTVGYRGNVSRMMDVGSNC